MMPTTVATVAVIYLDGTTTDDGAMRFSLESRGKCQLRSCGISCRTTSERGEQAAEAPDGLDLAALAAAGVSDCNVGVNKADLQVNLIFFTRWLVLCGKRKVAKRIRRLDGEQRERARRGATFAPPPAVFCLRLPIELSFALVVVVQFPCDCSARSMSSSSYSARYRWRRRQRAKRRVPMPMPRLSRICPTAAGARRPRTYPAPQAWARVSAGSSGWLHAGPLWNIERTYGPEHSIEYALIYANYSSIKNCCLNWLTHKPLRTPWPSSWR